MFLLKFIRQFFAKKSNCVGRYLAEFQKIFLNVTYHNLEIILWHSIFIEIICQYLHAEFPVEIFASE